MSEQELTKEEYGYIGIMRLNKLLPKNEIQREWQVGRMAIMFHWRSKKNLWGRFGGGWNWNLGFEAGGSTVILNLLICSLRINKVKK